MLSLSSLDLHDRLPGLVEFIRLCDVMQLNV